LPRAATLALCAWAVGISLIGLRTKSLPLWLCALGIVPAFRLLAALGALGFLPDGLWIVFPASIPGAMLWCFVLGVVLLRMAPTASPSPTLIAS
jgi:hypothetical protein